MSSDYQFTYLQQKKAPTQPAAPKKKPGGCRRIVVWMVQLGLIGLITAVLLFMVGYLYLSVQLEDAIDQIATYRGTGLGGTPRFYDRDGELLFELATVEKRRWLAYNEIPQQAIDAAVSVEDDTFWTNYGFDPEAIIAALIRNYRSQNGRPVGASTITQQLVRHIVFSYEERTSVSYWRKIREIFLAFIMTQKRTKPEIIQMYLNEIYYGNLAYGIEAAAQTYFGKSVQQLTLAEHAFLAGLPQAPATYDPYTNFDTAKARQEFVLDLMAEEGYITLEEAAAAKNAPLVLQSRIADETGSTDITLEAAHFVLYVQNELERRFGPDAIVQGGWQITTSLDLDIQKLAETEIRSQVAARAAAHNVSNGSVVVLKPKTGEILAMVGSLDYFDETIDGQVNIALQPRQPGSSIKPVTYVAAMERGWSTADVLWDVPIKVDLGGGELMQPRNYDGRFHGPVLFRDALANSYNIPPIQLIRDIGIPTFISTARRMGIESLKEPPGFYGLSLTLGGGEVPLLEMTHAYATLANNGQRPRLTSVLRIVDGRGNVIYDVLSERIPPANAVDPRIAYIITDILDDDRARVPAMGAGSALELPFPAAVKTGTTNDYRDNWTIGYTPGVVVGVWMGNADGTPMRDSSGLRGAAPVWNRIMQGIYGNDLLKQSLMVNGNFPPTEFLRPDGVEEREVCLPRGTGGTRCTASRTDLFVAGAPLHGIPRIAYNTNAQLNPGAWTLVTAPLPADLAERVVQAPLDDGTQPPRPTECVVHTAVSPGQGILYLPVPPFYPDEVRARIWAAGTGYRMAPPTICPSQVASSVTGSGGSGGTAGEGGGGGGVPSGTQAVIHGPKNGERIWGLTPVVGTAVFDPATVQFYKLEITSAAAPEQWVTFGTTHSQPVQDGVLEQLQADALPPGDYLIRLVLVGVDGNFVGQPYQVRVTISP